MIFIIIIVSISKKTREKEDKEFGSTFRRVVPCSNY